MVGLMPNDTGGSGNQKLVCTVEPKNGATGKKRALWAILPGITPGAYLAWIFYIEARQSRSQEIHLQRDFAFR